MLFINSEFIFKFFFFILPAPKFDFPELSNPKEPPNLFFPDPCPFSLDGNAGAGALKTDAGLSVTPLIFDPEPTKPNTP